MHDIREVLVLHHSHTDFGYTHTLPVVEELHERFLDRALELCAATADWDSPSMPRWTCEVTWPLLRWIERAAEVDRQRLRALVRAERIGAGALPCNLTPLWDTDQLARSLRPLAGLRERFGFPMRVAINHDVNGLSQPIVGLLRGCGVELILMGINTHFGGYPLERPLLFRWRALDGAEILVFNADHYQSFDRWLKPQSGSTECMAEGLAAYVEALPAGYAHDFVVLSATHFDLPDNNPPCALTADAVRRWNAEGRAPRLRYVTPDQLLARLREVPEADVPTHCGDWPDYWNFGCASSAFETRVNRRTKSRLRALETFACVLDSRSEDFDTKRTAAWRHASRFEEHTWGSWASVWNPEQDDVVAQWTLTAHEVFRGRSLTGWLWRETLEGALANPVEARGARGVLLHNPGPEARSASFAVPTQLVRGEWEHHASRVHNLECPRANLLDGEETTVGPIRVEAGATACLPLEEFARVRPPADGCRAIEGVIESPGYRLEFDPTDGRVLRLVDRELGRDVFDEGSAWQPFGWVRETVDRARHEGQPKYADRDALFQTDFTLLSIEKSPGWRTGWPAVREAAPAACRVAWNHSARGAELDLGWDEAPGARDVRLRIRLSADRKAVEVELRCHKLDEPRAEGLYVAFPLAQRAWRCHYDTSSLPVELDAEQLPGTVRDYQTVSSYVAVHDEEICCVLACPDAPMVQIGGFHFARALDRVPRDEPCLLLAWPMNNYWDTNFRISQPGFQQFRWELTSSAAFDPAAAARFGLSAACAVEFHPVVAPDEGTTRIPRLSLDSEDVLLRAAWLGHDGRSIQVELANPTSEARVAHLSVPASVASRAFVSNALEEPVESLTRGKDGFAIAVTPRSIVHLRLER